jgi:hypothetical protein
MQLSIKWRPPENADVSSKLFMAWPTFGQDNQYSELRKWFTPEYSIFKYFGPTSRALAPSWTSSIPQPCLPDYLLRLLCGGPTSEMAP